MSSLTQTKHFSANGAQIGAFFILFKIYLVGGAYRLYS